MNSIDWFDNPVQEVINILKKTLRVSKTEHGNPFIIEETLRYAAEDIVASFKEKK